MSTPTNDGGPKKRPKTVQGHIRKLVQTGFSDDQIASVLCREWAAWALNNLPKKIGAERAILAARNQTTK